jgi:hypothetical protein
MKAIGAGFLMIALSFAGQAAAAEPKELELQLGERIRYTLTTDKTGKGVLREIGPDYLRIEDKRGASLRLEKSALQSLGVVRGKKRNPVGGALIGFLPGAAFGAFAAGAMCDYGSPCDYAGPALVLGGMTAAVGAGIGALIKTDRWQQAPVSRVRFAIAPAKGGGVRAAVKLSF